MANTWQGNFPNENLALDGYERTSPVTAFPPNGYGVHDMIGNVWEWTSDWYSPKHEANSPKACCIPENPRGGPRPRATTPACPKSGSPARCSRAARIFARQTIAAVTARPRAMRSRSTRQRAMSALGASDEEEEAMSKDQLDDRPPNGREGIKRRDLLLSGSSLVAASAF